MTNSFSPQSSLSFSKADVLIVTVTKVESLAVMQAFEKATGQRPTSQTDKRVYWNLGVVNGSRIFLTQSEMGIAGLGASLLTVSKGIESLSPTSVIMVGIAFGINDQKQAIGDILVAVQLRPYDLQRVGTQNGKLQIRLRDDKPHASSGLINLFRSVDLRWEGAKVHFGTVLTGNKLVDNLDFREQLHSFEPEAIGGEMEGAGLYVACQDKKVDWILVKGICDWADGNKAEDKTARQQTAAQNAAGFVLAALQFTKMALSRPEVDGESPPDGDLRPSEDIDSLVKAVRQKVYGDIKARCGEMRVLDMTQPIGLGDIYTNVNILEKIIGRSWRELEEMLQGCDLENFDRFALSRVHEERVPGLDAVEKYRRLMILGKPGAGKTTFLKRLATLCNQGTFQPDAVPIFIPLKEFAEAKDMPSLLDYIAQQFAHCKVGDPKTTVEALLDTKGRALVLLDGLDEVREQDNDRVLREMKGLYTRFRDSQFVITCRIAAQEYVFESFVEVEVADFDDDQIKEFVQKWFHAKNDSAKVERFIQKLEDIPSIKELATNPLLLTLLCLVFGDANDFPRKRSELYGEGVDVLLKKWDAKRNIDRGEIYKNLSTKGKQDLLSQIAFKTFDKSEYFFKQRTVEQHITTYIENLPGVSTDPEVLKLDSEAVLRAIEAQHGLLVERARGIYSFSHLTFQEYFTARRATRPSFDPAQLVCHITEKRWREVFLLSVEMLDSADELLLLMKSQTDSLLSDDHQLQDFLAWANHKMQSVETSYKLAAVRVFYSWIALDLDLAFDLDLALALALARALDPEMKQALQALRSQLPNLDEDFELYEHWWTSHGQAWIEQLQAVMIKHRNIGHDWELSQEQANKLSQYFEANLWLVECLKGSYVTRPVREEIEETLLLPIAEINKRG